MIHITAHAIDRYRERVANIPDEQIRARLNAPIIARAIDFGARTIRLGTGQRLIIDNQTIVTITPKGYKLGCLAPSRDSLHRRPA